MNQTTVAGHLGSDPEVRFTSSGKKVTTLRVAAKVRKGSKDKDDTIWWRVSVWGEEFDKMMAYFKKGSAIIVVGEINKPEIFTDKEGRPQISMSMTAFNIMFSPFGRTDQPSASAPEQHHTSQEPNNYAAPHNESASYGQNKAPVGAGAFSDDEIPF